MVKAVLFDNDGTLVDTYDIILASMRHATKQLLGRDVPEAELMALVGQPLPTQMNVLAEGDEALGAELTRVYRAHNDVVHDECVKAFPGIVETVAALHAAGAPVAVVTSKRHDLAQRGLDLVGLAPYIDLLIGDDDWPEHKPKPGCITHACEVLGLNPADCLYVGDSPFDMQAGNAAGCETVAVLWGMFPESTLRENNPAHVIACPGELLGLAGC